MTTYLLDANAVISLLVSEHEHHARVAAWANHAGQLAICPVVEGAFTRFLVRTGESAATAQAALRALIADDRVTFWPDSASYADADLGDVIGHRQVTDAYLVQLAAGQEGVLATFDHSLAAARPNHTLLIP